MILSIDPGKDKCGLAVLNELAKVLAHKVIKSSELVAQVKEISAAYHLKTVVIGAGAFGKTAQKSLAESDLKLNYIFMTEKDSSWQARRRYWRAKPPQGLMKLIPTSLRVPPVPVDDYAAVIIGERYLKRQPNSGQS